MGRIWREIWIKGSFVEMINNITNLCAVDIIQERAILFLF